jgi:hypothetical protein
MSEERGVYAVNDLTRIAEAALTLTLQWQAMRMDTVMMMGALE